MGAVKSECSEKMNGVETCSTNVCCSGLNLVEVKKGNSEHRERKERNGDG